MIQRELPCKEYPVEILAYTAGIFDGEGSIIINIYNKNGRDGRATPSYNLCMTLSVTDKGVIDWLQGQFGGSINERTNCPSRIKSNRRPIWNWRLTGNSAKQLLETMYPYMRIKQKQAEIAIEFQKHITTYPQKFKKYRTQEQIDIREKYRFKLRSLTLGRMGI